MPYFTADAEGLAIKCQEAERKSPGYNYSPTILRGRIGEGLHHGQYWSMPQGQGRIIYLEIDGVPHLKRHTVDENGEVTTEILPSPSADYLDTLLGNIARSCAQDTGSKMDRLKF